ncbi:hypothetical protein DSO57_1022669 [Entomophthora muscae]|uniref:Uncharacterized protein n=1 Tax=Entomophthora muscae TaxID=34485 RepID=A0ACC2SS74_9FUNG|nr:hypothetical protein DSO57_1022669 [Entomophthora muscae]
MSSDHVHRLVAEAKAATSAEAELSKLESLEKLLRGNYQLLYGTFSQISSLAESDFKAVNKWLCELFRKAFTNNNLPHQIAPVLPRMLIIVSNFIQSNDSVLALKGLHCASGIFSSMLTLMINHPKVTPELWKALQDLARIGSGINVSDNSNLGFGVIKLLQVIIITLTSSNPDTKIVPQDHPFLPKNISELGLGYFQHLVSLTNLDGT